MFNFRTFRTIICQHLVNQDELFIESLVDKDDPLSSNDIDVVKQHLDSTRLGRIFAIMFLCEDDESLLENLNEVDVKFAAAEQYFEVHHQMDGILAAGYIR